MNIGQSFAMSWRSIRDHKLRSVLTTLGIIIGVGSVITFVTLGASLQAAVIGQVSADANPSIVASVGPASTNNGPGGPRNQGGSLPVFTEHDIEQLRGLSNVDSVIPQGDVQVSSLGYDGQTIGWQSVTATTANSFAADSFESGHDVCRREGASRPEQTSGEPVLDERFDSATPSRFNSAMVPKTSRSPAS